MIWPKAYINMPNLSDNYDLLFVLVAIHNKPYPIKYQVVVESIIRCFRKKYLLNVQQIKILTIFSF
jgi:hypothetical protein